jgi:zinc protease
MTLLPLLLVFASKGFPYPVERAKLANGLQAIVVPFDGGGQVTYYTIVRVGSRNEVEPGKSGFAHLFEHMMFRGTKRMTAEARQKLEQKLGINTNAWTSDDLTVYHMVGPTGALEQMIDLEGDRFAHTEYSKDAYATETQAVLGEYQKSASNPMLKLREAQADQAFTVHPYKHTTIGLEADVRAMPEHYEHSLDFFHRYYQPDNAIVLVVGDVTLQKVQAMLEKYYKDWNGKADPKPIPKEPEQTKEARRQVAWPQKTQPRLLIGWRDAGTPAIADAATEEVLASYLFGEASALRKSLVIDKQLAEGVVALYDAHRDPALWSVLVIAKRAADLPAIEQEIGGAIEAVRAGKVDAALLKDVRANLRYTQLINLETVEEVANALLPVHLSGDPDAAGKLIDAIDKVDQKALVTFAKTYLTPERRNVVTLVGKE